MASVVERLGWISLGLNAILGVGKVATGLLAGSTAVLADGLNSVSDMGTDVAVILGGRYARKPEDDDHPYGHHKFASLASLFVAASVLVVALGLVWYALATLARGSIEPPGKVAFFVAMGSMLVKELLYRRTQREARQLGSRLLLAQAWNLRSDALCSGVAALGAGAAWALGPRWAIVDPVAAVVLGAFLCVQGWKVLRRACDDLLDAAPEKALIDDLREHVLPTAGVRGYHAFRARRVGDQFEVDLHVQVDPNMTVEQGHQVAESVKRNIQSRHPQAHQILVHIEPGTDPHLRKAVGIHDRSHLPDEEHGTGV